MGSSAVASSCVDAQFAIRSSRGQSRVERDLHPAGFGALRRVRPVLGRLGDGADAAGGGEVAGR